MGNLNDASEADPMKAPRWTFVRGLLLGIALGLVLGFIAGSCSIPFGMTGFVTVRQLARRTACASNLKNISLASQMYLNEHGAFPFSARSPGTPGTPTPSSVKGGSRHIQLLFDEGFIDDPLVAICPASSDIPATPDAAGRFVLGAGNCSYVLNLKPLKEDSLGNDPLAACKAERGGPGADSHLEGRNVLLLDGNVKWVTAGDWDSLYKKHFTGQ